ncbi:MAG: monofunctional biosynthetic peptidoglycan transglycosylase [Elusimicrobiota bacterium]
MPHGRRYPLSRAIALRLLAAALAAAAVYVFWLPDVSPLEKQNPKTTAYIELRRRQAERAGKKFKPRMAWREFDAISEHLKRAVLITEDRSFYQHHGVDWESTREALKKDFRKRRLAFGGSTLTQQLARNLYLSPTKNPLRKIKEMLIARRLEKTLGKRRIFELYLNLAEWGKGIFGAEAAAQAYFGKSAAALDPEEAAALAVILPSPRRWNPVNRSRHVERGIDRVIAKMRASGYLEEEAAAKLDAPEPDSVVERVTFDQSTDSSR